jgi:hypothetical protein
MKFSASEIELQLFNLDGRNGLVGFVGYPIRYCISHSDTTSRSCRRRRGQWNGDLMVTWPARYAVNLDLIRDVLREAGWTETSRQDHLSSL